MAGLFGRRRRSASGDAERAAEAALSAAVSATNSVDSASRRRGLFGPVASSAPDVPPTGAVEANPPADGWKPSAVDTIWGVLAGYSPNKSRQMQIDEHNERVAAQQQRDAVGQLRSQATDPREALLWAADPAAMAKEAAERYGAARQPRIVEGPDGIYSIGADGNPTKIQAYEKQAPSGWMYENGALKPIPGGPADPAYIGSVAGTRRDAVVERPMPRAGGGRSGGGRSSGSSGLPAGFQLD